MIRTAALAAALAIVMIAFALLLWLAVVSSNGRFTFHDALFNYGLASTMVAIVAIGPGVKRWDVYERALTSDGELVTFKLTFEAGEEDVATKTIYQLTGAIPALFGSLELVPHGVKPTRARTMAEIAEVQIGQTNRNFGTIPGWRAKASATANAIEGAANEDGSFVIAAPDEATNAAADAFFAGRRVGNA